MIEPAYQEIGKRLRAIRKELRLTLEILSGDTGIFRSYLSDFERGTKLPTAKFLNYLYIKLNVNLHFVLGGNGRMFRENYPDFDIYLEPVNELLFLMEEMPLLLHAVLSFFEEFKLVYKELIELNKANKEREKETQVNQE